MRVMTCPFFDAMVMFFVAPAVVPVTLVLPEELGYRVRSAWKATYLQRAALASHVEAPMPYLSLW